ncbi:MAG: nuclear transport factor 2 family protein [Betaproteobacteria bacterium]|nr:nuclear transport factor 2 family protein [Betaproteobacteria bacterium]
MDGILVQMLSRLEAELHQSTVRADDVRVRTLLHPDFEEIGRSGRCYSRDTVVAAMQNESQVVEVTADLYVATELRPGVALLTYRSALRQEDGSLARHTLRSSIWLLVGSNWLLRYHQGTAAAEIW